MGIILPVYQWLILNSQIFDKFFLMKLFLGFLVLTISFHITYSQDDDNLILGKSNKQTTAAVYDLSDPTGVNIEVSLWGTIRYPGRYRVPVNSTFLDLMSYAGGPLETSNLEDIRIMRETNNPAKKPQVIKLNYNDLLWGDQVKTERRLNPLLQSGDIILVLEQKRYTFRDNFIFFLPIVSSIIGIITLIITLRK
jgi:hypothetical protein